MNKKTFELYYYMNSDKSIYDWLVKEGAKTKTSGLKILSKYLKKNKLSAEIVLPKLTVINDDQLVDSSYIFFDKVLNHFEK